MSQDFLPHCSPLKESRIPSLFGHMVCVIVLTGLTATVAGQSVGIFNYTRDKLGLPVAMAARTDGLLLVDASSGPAAHGALRLAY
jgi:hypothetical protein